MRLPMDRAAPDEPFDGDAHTDPVAEPALPSRRGIAAVRRIIPKETSVPPRALWPLVFEGLD
jgi:hypothetical protein